MTNLSSPYSVTGVTTAGSFLVTVTASKNAEVYSLANRFFPNLTGSFGLPGVAFGASSNADFIFIAAGSGGLALVDIDQPVLLSSFYDRAHFSEDVAVRGQYAFAADGASGMRTIDISNPKAPSYAATITMSGQLNASVFESGYANSLVVGR